MKPSQKKYKEEFKVLEYTSTPYSKYCAEDYFHEKKYLKSLSKEEKKWLNSFLLGYYYQLKTHFDEVGFTVAQRRKSYNVHKGVKRDIFNKSNRLTLDTIYSTHQNKEEVKND